MTNTEIIDCTTCKYGYENERLGIPMCHHPKRFSEDCVDFNMHEEKETEESEKPINLDDAMKELDEKIALVRRRGTWDGVDVDKYMDEVRGRESEKPMNLEEEIIRYLHEECSDDDEPGIHEIAEHFAEWGYLRAAEKYNEIEYNRQRAEESVPNGLEEAAKKHFKQEWNENYLAFEGDVINTFIAGAKLQKEQMMKEAVEGKIAERRQGKLYARCQVPKTMKAEFGDKVRIIVVKEHK